MYCIYLNIIQKRLFIRIKIYCAHFSKAICHIVDAKGKEFGKKED